MIPARVYLNWAGQLHTLRNIDMWLPVVDPPPHRHPRPPFGESDLKKMQKFNDNPEENGDILPGIIRTILRAGRQDERKHAQWELLHLANGFLLSPSQGDLPKFLVSWCVVEGKLEGQLELIAHDNTRANEEEAVSSLITTCEMYRSYLTERGHVFLVYK